MKAKLLTPAMATAVLYFTIMASPAGAETVTLSVAASMTEAFTEIIALFSKDHPEVELAANFGSSGSLAKQIEQGAPADLYVSANPKWMAYLVQKGLIEPGSGRIFAHNQLVLVSTRSFTGLELGRLLELDRIALGTPQSVPAGQYAKQALEAQGIYRELERSNRLVFAKDVRQALLYADRGEVDGAFVYATDALLARQARTVLVVPEELYDRVSYPLGLTTTGGGKEAAWKFLSFMASDRAIGVLKTFGFQPAAAEPSGEL